MLLTISAGQDRLARGIDRQIKAPGEVFVAPTGHFLSLNGPLFFVTPV